MVTRTLSSPLQYSLYPRLNTNKGGDILAVLAAGLPEISGAFGAIRTDGNKTVSGCFYANGSSAMGAGDGGNSNTKIGFKASISSRIYGASSTVQPPALQLIPQIKY